MHPHVERVITHNPRYTGHLWELPMSRTEELWTRLTRLIPSTDRPDVVHHFLSRPDGHFFALDDEMEDIEDEVRAISKAMMDVADWTTLGQPPFRVYVIERWGEDRNDIDIRELRYPLVPPLTLRRIPYIRT